MLLELKWSGSSWFYQGTLIEALIEAFTSTHNFDILCLFESFLDSTIDLNYENINIDGYSIVRADHPSNNKRGGDCI